MDGSSSSSGSSGASPAERALLEVFALGRELAGGADALGDYRARLARMRIHVRLLDPEGQELPWESAGQAVTVELRSARVIRTAELEGLDDQGRCRLLAEGSPLGSAVLLLPVAP